MQLEFSSGISPCVAQITTQHVTSGPQSIHSQLGPQARESCERKRRLLGRLPQQPGNKVLHTVLHLKISKLDLVGSS